MELLNTFWSIISKQGIEIPPIQRDYAQGRKSEKIETIRKKFIESICTALEKNEQLRLDFIYGKIYGIRNEEEHRRNKHAINSLLRSIQDYASTIDLTFNELEIKDKSPNKEGLVYLIPLDGQQRLTTLFLFHWYFSTRLNLTDNLVVLKRFKYKTRKSSLSFINLLCSNIQIDFNKPLDEEIKGLENFSNTWLDDPTVNSILVVLKAIHKNYITKSNEDIAIYMERLTTEKKIFFDFLDLKDFNLSDELYVKMNARGKQLSDFENFKAWLFGQIESEELVEGSIWEANKKSFDIQWNDIFWNIKESNEFEIDEVYFNYFKLVFVYDLIRLIKLDGTNFEESIELNTVNLIQKNAVIDFENRFDKLFFKNIQMYFKILDICSGYNSKNTILLEFYQFYFSKSGIAPSWNNLIKHYILFSYLTTKSKKLVEYSEEDWKNLSEYFRILNNLFRNTIIDNPSLYKSAVNEVDEITRFLKDNNFDVSKWIEILEYNSKSVFQKHQIEEEILKYRLLSKNTEWKLSILDAESISYFEGQLNFWFFKTGITLDKSRFSEDFYIGVYLNSFNSVTNNIKKLFNSKGINRTEDFSERIFERALLSKSDYLLNEGGYKCFGRNIGRDVSWKRLFLRDRNNDDTNIALKEIFDLDFDSVNTSFQEYIEKNEEIYSKHNWRKTLIENKELFNYIGNQKYIRKIDNHGWVLIKDNYKTYTGAHYELFSLDFYIKHLKEKIKEFTPFIEIDYYPAPKNNLDDIPCAHLNWKKNDFNYALDISYSKDTFNLRFFKRDSKISEEVKTILTKEAFVLNSDSYELCLPESEALSKLNTLCVSFKKLKL